MRQQQGQKTAAETGDSSRDRRQQQRQETAAETGDSRRDRRQQPAET